MDSVSIFIPKRIGLDQFRIIIGPAIIASFYYGLLFLQTRIKDEDNKGAIGYVFYFTRSRSSSVPYQNQIFSNYLIVILFAIWISILTIKSKGNLGNVAISSFVFGIFYFFLDLLFYIYYTLEDHKNETSWDREGFIYGNNKLFSAILTFNLIEFMMVSIIFAGIYFEVVLRYVVESDVDLYPKH
ncbi:MAG: hypothetical protein GPJ54_16130 [Candidatus Heimdallarchaeota archaeon]|nr:hypothetical protein [Candidatus Heimdallarchaeota archaeon]